MPAEPPVRVLTNTTPLIALAQVGVFPLLRDLSHSTRFSGKRCHRLVKAS